jgi:hypothetical protein
MHKFIFTLTIFFIAISVRAQVAELGTIDGQMFAPNIVNGKFLAFSTNTKGKYVVRMDLETGVHDTEYIDSRITYDPTFTDSGFYFYRGTTQQSGPKIDTLMFLNFYTNQVLELPVYAYSNANKPIGMRIQGIRDGRLLICAQTFIYDQFDVWVIDIVTHACKKLGTIPTFDMVHILDNDVLLFTTENSQNQESLFAISSPTSQPVLLNSTASANSHQIRTKAFQGKYYFVVNHGNARIREVWETNFTPETTIKLYETIYPIRTNSIQPDGTIYTTRNMDIYQRLSNGNAYVPINDSIIALDFLSGQIIDVKSFAQISGIKNADYWVNNAKNLQAIYTSEYGFELLYWNFEAGDTPKIIDINQGTHSFIHDNYSDQLRNRMLFCNNTVTANDSFYVIGHAKRSNKLYFIKVKLVNGQPTLYTLAPFEYEFAYVRNYLNHRYFVYNGNVYFLIYNIDQNRLLNLIRVDESNIENMPVLSVSDSADTWHKQFGYGYVPININFSIHAIHTDIANNDDIVVTFSHRDIGNLKNSMAGTLKPLVDYDADRLLMNKAVANTFKLTPKGNVKWIRSHGGYSLSIFPQLPVVQAVDKNGSVFICGKSYGNSIVGNDSIYTNNYVDYIIKYESNTGDVVFSRVISSDNVIEVERLITDEIGNLYVAFKYSQFSVMFDGVLLNNQGGVPTNGLAKYDNNGNLLWVKNILTPFEDIYGATRSLYFDNKSNQLYIMQSQGSFNWWSSCKFTNWYTFIQCVRTDGDILWTKQFMSDDLHSTRFIGLNSEGLLQISGYFRGKFTFDKKVIESDYDRNLRCNQFQYFNVTLRPDNGRILEVYTHDDATFLPDVFAVDEKNDIYTIGYQPVNWRGQNLHIKQLSKEGFVEKERNLKKFEDAFDFGFSPDIDVQNGYVVVADFTTTTFDTFTNINEANVNLSVARYRIDEALSPVQILYPTANSNPPTLLKNYDMLMYPNPVVDMLMLKKLDDAEIYSVSVYNLEGRLVQNQLMDIENRYAELDLRLLNSGVYILEINGSNGKETTKIVKQ